MSSPAAVATLRGIGKRAGLRDFAKNAAGNGVFMFLGVVSSIASARLLAPSARGELSAAMAWTLLLSALGDLGITQAIPVLAARDERTRGPLFSTSLVLSILLPAVLLLPAVVILYCHVLSIPAEVTRFTLILLLVVPMNLAGACISAAFQGIGAHGAFNTQRILGNLPYTLVLTGAFILGVRDVGWILIAYVAVSLVLLIVALGLAYRWWPHQQEKPDLRLAKSMVKFGSRAYVGNIAWVSNGKLGPVFLSATVTTGAIGLFSVAASYAMLQFAVGSAIAFLAPSYVSGCVESVNAKRKARMLFHGAVGASLASTVVMILCAGFLLTAVFGQAYEGSVAIARVLTAVTAILGLNFVLSATLRALDRPFAPSVAELIGLGLTLFVTVPLIHAMGAVGAAWAGLLSAMTTFAFLYLQFQRATRS